MSLVDTLWPLITDDDGSGKYGTPVNKPNVWDVIKAAINNQVASGTNPALTPAQIIDEVVAARGNLASLALRLASVIDVNGALIVPATVVSATQGGNPPFGNLVENADLLVWCEGDLKPPSGFSAVSPGSLTVNRAGPGSGVSTSVLSFGEHCMYFPVNASGSYPAYAPNDILNVTEFARCLGFRGRKIAFGARIKSTDANTIGIALYDGVTTTTFYHSGSGNEEWVGGVVALGGGATRIQLRVVVNQANAGIARVGALTAVFSDVALKDFIPPVMQGGVVHFAGTSAVMTGLARFVPGRLGVITGVFIQGGVTGGNHIDTDVKNWDVGAATSVSIYAAGGPSLVAASPYAFKAPDGAYFRRCIQGSINNVNGNLMSYDITADTTGGTLVTSEVRVLQYVRPLEGFKDHLV